jgi:hypothetical protein
MRKRQPRQQRYSLVNAFSARLHNIVNNIVIPTRFIGEDSASCQRILPRFGMTIVSKYSLH